MVCDELTPILGHPVTVSAAGPISGADDVWRGFLEAQRCLDAMTAFGATGRSASARQLGFLGLLLADNHDVEGFIDSVVGPVVDYDRQRFTDLVRTLETYFNAGASPTGNAQIRRRDRTEERNSAAGNPSLVGASSTHPDATRRRRAMQWPSPWAALGTANRRGAPLAD